MGLFRREDNDEIIEVSFEKTMEQDAMGCIKLEDGVTARRCVHLELMREGKVKRQDGNASTVSPPIVSDALGFQADQFHEMEEDRKRHGFTGVEFVPDPSYGGFYQAKFSTWQEKERYRKHRDERTGIFKDKNSRCGSGAMLSKRQLEAAQRMAREKYPENSGSIVVDERQDQAQTQIR